MHSALDASSSRRVAQRITDSLCLCRSFAVRKSPPITDETKPGLKWMQASGRIELVLRQRIVTHQARETRQRGGVGKDGRMFGLEPMYFGCTGARMRRELARERDNAVRILGSLSAAEVAEEQIVMKRGRQRIGTRRADETAFRREVEPARNGQRRIRGTETRGCDSIPRCRKSNQHAHVIL